jgi:uncharacterized protein
MRKVLIGIALLLPITTANAQPRTGTPEDDMGRFVSKVLGSTEVHWKEVFARDGKTYRAPPLVLYRGATQSGCGFGESAS